MYFGPETAVKCVRPATLKSSTRSSDSAEVSPTTSPGSRPAGSWPRVRAAPARNPVRNEPAASWGGLGAPSSCGGSSTATAATVRSLRCGGCTRPRTRRCCPGSSPAQPSAGASRTTAPPSCGYCPEDTRSARTSTRAGIPGTAAPRSALGSSVSTTSRSSRAPSAPASGWVATACARRAVATEKQPSTASTASIPAAQPRSRWRTSTSAAAATDPAASTAATCHPASTPTPVAPHAATAEGTSRTSRRGSARAETGPLTPAPGP